MAPCCKPKNMPESILLFTFNTCVIRSAFPHTIPTRQPAILYALLNDWNSNATLSAPSTASKLSGVSLRICAYGLSLIIRISCLVAKAINSLKISLGYGNSIEAIYTSQSLSIVIEFRLLQWKWKWFIVSWLPFIYLCDPCFFRIFLIRCSTMNEISFKGLHFVCPIHNKEIRHR